MSIDVNELFERMRGNDATACETFYRLFYPMTYRAAHVITGDRDLALDAVQETFTQAFQRIGQVREKEKVGAWLAVIATNQARRLMKERRHLVPYPQESFPDDRQERPFGEEPTFDGIEDKIMVRAALRSLEPEARQILVLKYIHGFTEEEIATKLKVARGTVKSRLHRARAVAIRSLAADPKPDGPVYRGCDQDGK